MEKLFSVKLPASSSPGAPLEATIRRRTGETLCVHVKPGTEFLVASSIGRSHRTEEPRVYSHDDLNTPITDFKSASGKVFIAFANDGFTGTVAETHSL